MRFSIRDLLWLTVVVAFCVGWALDHRRLEAEIGDREPDIQAFKALVVRRRSRHECERTDQFGWAEMVVGWAHKEYLALSRKRPYAL